MKNPLKFLFPVPSLLLEISQLLIRQERILADLTLRLTNLETQMSLSKEEFAARLRAVAETVKSNASLLNGIVTVNAKIFEEVRNLKAQTTTDADFEAALTELEAATNSEVATIAEAIAIGTKVDELNPDLAVDENGVVVNTAV